MQIVDQNYWKFIQGDMPMTLEKSKNLMEFIFQPLKNSIKSQLKTEYKFDI